jgi:undecaprenyl-diphosphatase
MTLLQSFLLGIIQGLTEFLPVSSTAHLLIAQNLFRIPASDAVFSFLVIVQMGTLLSLVVVYWKDLISIVLALINFGRPSPERDLGIYIIIATVPALLAGYLLKSRIEHLFKDPLLQAAIRLLSAAILLALAEWLTKKNRQLNSMTWLDALVVGLFQIISVFPGASRSGTTIAGSMFRGFDRPAAARFAFLIGVPVTFAAGGYETLGVLRAANFDGFLPLIAVGFITAAIVGWFAIEWLLAFLHRHSLYVFAAYCAIVGLVCLVVSLF